MEESVVYCSRNIRLRVLSSTLPPARELRKTEKIQVQCICVFITDFEVSNFLFSENERQIKKCAKHGEDLHRNVLSFSRNSITLLRILISLISIL
jgi:hypothetical protein